jgi:hypothetical protein
MTVSETKRAMESAQPHWQVPLMDFVDEFRRTKDVTLVHTPYPLNHERFDALLASTIEYLCDELGIEPPAWVWTVPGCRIPWFVSGIENLKAIAIVESPVYFRRRKIFVLENFLSRV